MRSMSVSVAVHLVRHREIICDKVFNLLIPICIPIQRVIGEDQMRIRDCYLTSMKLLRRSYSGSVLVLLHLFVTQDRV